MVGQIAAHGDDTVILTATGDCWVSGKNLQGEFGLGDITKIPEFRRLSIPLEAGTHIRQITLGFGHSFILLNNGDCWVCGYKDEYQLGAQDLAGRYYPAPLAFKHPDGIGIQHLALGYNHSFIVFKNGECWVCGRNAEGQLGLGHTDECKSYTKLELPFDKPIQQIVLGGNHSFILLTNGECWVTGSNTFGELGLGDTQNRSVFTQLSLENKLICQIALGESHSLLLTRDNECWSCGYNKWGQLGLNNIDNRNMFTKIPLLTNEPIQQIASGNDHSFIITAREAWVSGNNDNGQLGLNNTQESLSFTNINLSLPQGIKIQQVSLGDVHSTLLLDNGEYRVCGSNEYGQLGLTEKKCTEFVPLTLPEEKSPLLANSHILG